MSDIYKESVKLHDQLQGKIDITNKMDVNSKEDLSLLYSPGVAEPCLEIQRNPERAYDLTIKNNTIAVNYQRNGCFRTWRYRSAGFPAGNGGQSHAF